MDAGFVFHDAVDTLVGAGELEDDLLVATGSTRGLVGDFQLPAAAFRVLAVHAEQVAGEDGGFVAAGAAADLDHGILAVVGIGRDQQELDVLFHVRDLRFDVRDDLPGHFPQVLVFLVDQDILGGRQLIEQGLVFLSGFDDRLKFLVVLVELDVLLHVAHHLGIGELVLQFLELVLQAHHFFQQCILICHKSLFFNVFQIAATPHVQLALIFGPHVDRSPVGLDLRVGDRPVYPLGLVLDRHALVVDGRHPFVLPRGNGTVEHQVDRVVLVQGLQEMVPPEGEQVALRLMQGL